jgi:hypothetical protein
MIDGDDCGAIGGMNECQGKPAPVPLCPPQIPHDLSRVTETDRMSYGTAVQVLSDEK